MVNEFEGLDLHCSGHENVQVPIANMTGVFKEYCPITTGEEFLASVRLSSSSFPIADHPHQVSFSSDNYVRNCVLLGGFYGIFLVATFLLIKFLKWQKR